MTAPDTLREALESARSEIVVAIAFLGRDAGTERLDNSVQGLIRRLVKADEAARAALSAQPAAPAGRDSLECANCGAETSFPLCDDCAVSPGVPKPSGAPVTPQDGGFTEKQLEAGAKAIARMVPTDGGRWNEGHGYRFPQEYSVNEATLIRAIARTCLDAALPRADRGAGAS